MLIRENSWLNFFSRIDKSLFSLIIIRQWFLENSAPESLRVGKWSVIPQKRGNKYYYKAFRTYPGERSPRCVYIGQEVSEDIVRQKIRNKGFTIDDER